VKTTAEEEIASGDQSLAWRMTPGCYAWLEEVFKGKTAIARTLVDAQLGEVLHVEQRKATSMLDL
jgi:hypothetical protein